MTRRKKIVIAAIIAIVTLPLVCYCLPYERRHYGCAHCRLEKLVASYCGVAIIWEIPNDCSKWYVKARPGHEHEWAVSGCTYRRRGLTAIYECPFTNKVFQVMPEMQKAFLSSCTPQQEEQWFELMMSRKREDYEKGEKMASDVFFGKAASADSFVTSTNSEQP